MISDVRVASAVMTSGACPEQYSGELADGRPFYFRYRHGWASLAVGPDCNGGEDVGMAYGDGLQGVFESDEARNVVFSTLLNRREGHATPAVDLAGLPAEQALNLGALTAELIAEAEARGYQRAIDALRAMGRIFEVPDELVLGAAERLEASARSATPDAEPAPRTWVLPDEPGPEVTQLRADQLAAPIVRSGRWWLATHEPDDEPIAYTWRRLVFEFSSPLIDATNEPAPGGER